MPPPQLRQMWQDACDFVGAKPGETWTESMEEAFAKAGEKFLLTGKAPNVALQPLFDDLKKRFMDVYSDAQAAQLEISPA